MHIFAPIRLQTLKAIIWVSFILITPLRAISPADEPAVKVVNQVLPSVVNIYTERTVTHTVQDPFDDFYEKFFGGGYSRGARIQKIPVRNLGSGFIVSSSGYVVTNQHVVQRAADLKIKVSMSNGKDYQATLVRADEDLDLALVKITGEKSLPFLDMAEVSPNYLGQTVIAIGNPIGYESSVSMGILSAKNRTLTLEGISFEGLLQTDAAINPGNSGGPLVDINGKLSGMNSAKMGTSRGMVVENIGFAIPAERVKAFVEESIAIAEGKKPEPPKVDLAAMLKAKFGFSLQEMTPELAQSLNYRADSGLLVADVESGSPAAQAGVEKGMVFVGIGNLRVRSLDSLPRNIQKIKKGDEVDVTFLFLQKRGNFLIQRSGAVKLTARQ